ncbi:MAG: ABC transporter permease [Hyphomicrobiales bacterium]|nr:ABC transporter permease [Hyphomicrobiales bacterium]
MRRALRSHPVEVRLFVVLIAMCVGLSLASDHFLTLGNLTSLLNNNSVNLIWAVGLLVVLVAGGIDISFAVAASVVQYVAVYCFQAVGGGNWVIGFVVCGLLGIGLGLINAWLIHGFRIISIVVTIATFNVFFGLLMFFTSGRFIYNLPDWWVDRIFIFEHQSANGTWSELNLAVAVMVGCVVATWVLIRHTTLGRQLYAFGDNPEGARRAGVNIAVMQALAFGWMGLMAGIGGLMQVNIVKEVVPNALIGRELEVLAAVVLGGARLGGGSGTIFGCITGVLFVAITQNGLNLLGVSPFAFQMIIGGAILIAISTSNLPLELSAWIDSVRGRAPSRDQGST